MGETHEEAFKKMEGALSPAHFQAIGLLIATAGAVEAGLKLYALKLCHHPEAGRGTAIALVGGMELKTTLTVIELVGSTQFPAHKKAIEDACAEIFAAFGDRNTIAHNISKSATPEVMHVLSIKLGRRGGHKPPKPYTVPEIKAAALRIFTGLRELGDVLVNAGATALHKDFE